MFVLLFLKQIIQYFCSYSFYLMKQKLVEQKVQKMCGNSVISATKFMLKQCYKSLKYLGKFYFLIVKFFYVNSKTAAEGNI